MTEVFPLRAATQAARTQTVHLPGEAGRIELLLDYPDGGAVKGVALITHPQPVLGGSPRHKVPHRLARAAQALGWLAVRPAFRGVGGTEGEYDEGEGETRDVLAVVRAIRAQDAALPLALVGFSFGAYVAARAARVLADEANPAQVVTLAGLPVGTVPAGRHYDTPAVPADTLLVHGERDEMAPFDSLLAWARPSAHPIVLVPGADHFFSGHLDKLVGFVAGRLAGPARGA